MDELGMLKEEIEACAHALLQHATRRHSNWGCAVTLVFLLIKLMDILLQRTIMLMFTTTYYHNMHVQF